ncbi:hypothetical protein H0H87_010527 [Tephrocybe sp. NHM501043]|nr:hypothetical protein H0H87_010527 [Tephrocybe sp. NHM501043]
MRRGDSARIFSDKKQKKIAQEVPGNCLGNEWKDYIFRIPGGNDKQGFLMKQGVLLPYRVRLPLADGHSCYRTRHAGERKHNPKIQRLVTPLRLQRRRHLHSLKRRRIEHQKEQKAEFEALLSKRVAEKKAKVAAIKAAHKTAA